MTQESYKQRLADLNDPRVQLAARTFGYQIPECEIPIRGCPTCGKAPCDVRCPAYPMDDDDQQLAEGNDDR